MPFRRDNADVLVRQDSTDCRALFQILEPRSPELLGCPVANECRRLRRAVRSRLGLDDKAIGRFLEDVADPNSVAVAAPADLVLGDADGNALESRRRPAVDGDVEQLV